MKTFKKDNNVSIALIPLENSIKILLLSLLLMMGIISPSLAQTTETSQAVPSWWFGVVGGANFNFYEGSTQQLNAAMTPPLAFHDGFGAGLFLGTTIEYYKPNTRLGAMLQLGYDNRKADFDQIITACNCPADLSANLSYFTIEPSVRFAPFRNSFYLYGGPRLAFNIDKSFSYQLGLNPDVPNQAPTPEVNGDFSNMNNTLISMQIGAGYDIPISSKNKPTQFLLSPFVSFHPYFGQNPRGIETWNLTTIRAGVALKFGVAKKFIEEIPAEVMPTQPKVAFSVVSPENIPAERKVRETFPLRNYVFFDLGSTQIPNRYVKLQKSEVAAFEEDNVSLVTPENFSGRSKRQLAVYYNILNILGDRMDKNPSTNINLVGSSEVNNADGKAMAESVKTYLVDIFSIVPSRITTVGTNEPKIPSQQAGGTQELTLLKEGDRRVSIESSSPILLMEFQSGPNAPLKPIEVELLENAPIDSYVSFVNEKAKENFVYWNIETKDKKGAIKTFGPFTEDLVMIPGKDILGTNEKGTYNVKMIGTTNEGEKITEEASVDMVLWNPAETEVATRFSVIYEFDESDAIEMYSKYITEVVVPKIPNNAKVIIRGHTDVIGDKNYNQNLATKRAKDVENIIKNELTKLGRTDVNFEVKGFGEDENLSPFANKYPEERFYNRTVIIDIIPRK